MLAIRVATARQRHGNRTIIPLVLRIHRLLPFVTIGCVLGVFTSIYIIPLLVFRQTSTPGINDPTYSRQTERPASCAQFIQQNTHEFAGSVTCIRLKSSSSTALLFELTPFSFEGHTLTTTFTTTTTTQDGHSKEKVVQSSSLSLENHTSTSFMYSVSHLKPCTEYRLTVESFRHTHPKRQVLCMGQAATICEPPRGNLVQNPSLNTQQNLLS